MILSRLKKYKFGSLILAGMILSGCRDEKLYEPTDSDESVGAALSFKIAYDATRADDALYGGHSQIIGTNYENYVDLSNNGTLRILFFNKNNEFLFEVPKRYASPYTYIDSEGNEAQGVEVTVPETNFYDEAERAGVGREAVRAAIHGAKEEGGGFKIAVLANWPKTVEGPRTGYQSDGTPNVAVSGVSTAIPFVKDDKLQKLNHCIYDNVYGAKYVPGDADYVEGEENQAFRYQSYNHLIDKDGNMGVYSVWVENYFGNRSEAAKFIRNAQDENGAKFSFSAEGEGNSFKYTPVSYTRVIDNLNQYKMDDVWRVWNFSFGKTAGAEYYGSDAAKKYWKKRNFELISDWDPTTTTECDGLEIINPRNDNSFEDKFLKLRESTINKNYFFESKNVIHFRAYSEGTLRIKAKSGSTTSAVQMWIGSALYNNQEGKEGTKTEYTIEDSELKTEITDLSLNEDGVSGYTFRIDPSSKPYTDVYIGAVGATLLIYEIEFIRDRHIYDTDRKSVMVDRDHLIPMYGVQEFDPIPEDDWKDGTIYHLSDQNEDNHGYWGCVKQIFLLRSISKVVLQLKQDVFKNNKPTHVYMRTSNRSARCEPNDVITPTDILWNGGDINGENWGGVDAELKTIYNVGPIAALNQSLDYSKLTAWFHRIWATDLWNPTWDWNEGSSGINTTSIDAELSSAGIGDYPYPRIYNSRVDRSDFAHFLEIEPKDGYYRYILYTCEKNIDDPTDVGARSSRAKVPHIEIRFGDEINNDDNAAYRIYFADNSNGNGPVAERDSYEDDVEDLGDRSQITKLYPIMRNHIYQFTVNGINPGNTVDFQVCTPANRTAGTITFD